MVVATGFVTGLLLTGLAFWTGIPEAVWPADPEARLVVVALASFGGLVLIAAWGLVWVQFRLREILGPPSDVAHRQGQAAQWEAIKEEVHLRRRKLGEVFEEPDVVSSILLPNNTRISPERALWERELWVPTPDDLKRARRAQLAAVDLFVEKAQGFLTRRAVRLAYYGSYCGALAFFGMIAGIVTLSASPKPDSALQSAAATVLIVRSVGLGGFLAGIVAFLIYMCRALLHESTVLLNRRHSLRFGRMVTWVSAELSVDDLEKAFAWSGDYGSAFIRIPHTGPKGMQGIAEKAIEELGKASKSKE